MYYTRDIGKRLMPVFQAVQGAATAAGSGDASEITGASVDRRAYQTDFQNATLIVHGQATLASGKTISIAANLQDSADNSAWADYGDALAATVVATGPSGGGAVNFAVKLSVNLQTARRYLRAQWTPDMNATGTDTSVQSALLVLGGADEEPA